MIIVCRHCRVAQKTEKEKQATLNYLCIAAAASNIGGIKWPKLNMHAMHISS